MEAATLPCRQIWTHDVRAVARQSDGLPSICDEIDDRARGGATVSRRKQHFVASHYTTKCRGYQFV